MKWKWNAYLIVIGSEYYVYASITRHLQLLYIYNHSLNVVMQYNVQVEEGLFDHSRNLTLISMDGNCRYSH